MKTKDLKSLRSKSDAEIVKLIDQKVSALRKAKIAQIAQKAKNLKEVKLLKREIAQLKTLVSEKRILAKIEKKAKEVNQK